jgi:hypothetical protein
MQNVCLILNTIAPVCIIQFLCYSLVVFAQPAAQGLAVRGLCLYFWGHKCGGYEMVGLFIFVGGLWKWWC